MEWTARTIECTEQGWTMAVGKVERNLEATTYIAAVDYGPLSMQSDRFKTRDEAVTAAGLMKKHGQKLVRELGWPVQSKAGELTFKNLLRCMKGMKGGSDDDAE